MYSAKFVSYGILSLLNGRYYDISVRYICKKKGKNIYLRLTEVPKFMGDCGLLFDPYALEVLVTLDLVV